MTVINSYDEFIELRNKIVRERRFRLHNLLLTDIEMKNIINNGRLLYEDCGEYVTLTVSRDRADYIYFYTDKPEKIILQNTNKPSCFIFYGSENEKSIWDDVAKNLNFKFEGKGCRMTVKTNSIERKLPNDRIVFNSTKVFDREKFLTLCENDFTPIRGNFPEPFEWDVYASNKELIEMYDNERFVGFCVIAIIGKKAVVEKIAVANEYRGQGMGKLLLSFASKDASILQLWVYEDNINAMRFYEKFGLIHDKQYVKYYLKS